MRCIIFKKKMDELTMEALTAVLSWPNRHSALPPLLGAFEAFESRYQHGLEAGDTSIDSVLHMTKGEHLISDALERAKDSQKYFRSLLPHQVVIWLCRAPQYVT